MLRNILQNLNIFLKQCFSINNFDNHIETYFLGLKIRKKLPTPKIDLNIKEYGLTKEKRETKIILSLTSFPQRISIVPKTIKTLLKQTIKPDEVVLWLAEEQFPKKEEELPQELLELREYGLSIKWCNDIRSYKKLIPSLKEYPNDIIITFDDDIYYPNNVVELLYNEYLKNPNHIYANRVRRFYLKNNNLYSQSKAQMHWIKNPKPSFLNKITGCGGVLYPPNSLNEKVFDEITFKEIIPTQDDVWFWAMAILNNTKIKEVAGFNIQLITIEDSQKYGLSKINAKNNTGIDSLEASRKIIKHYPQIIDTIKNNVVK